MGDKEMSGIISLLRQYWKLAAVISGAIFVFVVLPLFLAYGRIKNPGFCAVCHETLYDYKEYAVNTQHFKMPRGVVTGCVECHPSPFFEFKGSDHYKTKKIEYKPGCANCHKPHSIGLFAAYMYLEVSPWEKVMGALTKDMEVWERDIRPNMAKKSREGFLKEDSKPCKDCHITVDAGFDGDLEPHKIGSKEKMTCIECHFNLVHKEVPWPEMQAKKERLGIE